MRRLRDRRRRPLRRGQLSARHPSRPAGEGPDDERLPDDHARPSPPGVRWAAVSALVAGYLLAFVVRYGTAVVLPGLRADLGAGEAALGLLAAAYFWPYALVQPLAGVLSDWWGARRAVPVFLAGAAAGTALFAAAPSLPLALVGRALGGAGVGIVYVCGISLIGQWVSPQRFGTASGLFAASGMVGGLVAARPLHALVGALGWRAAFGVVAAALLATAALAALAIPVRHTEVGVARPPLLRGLTEALRLRDLWLTSTYAFVILGILSSMQGLWTIPFLTDVYGLDAQAAAAVLEAWSVGLLVAIPFWGFLADRIIGTRKGAILVSAALHGAVWVLLAAAPRAWPTGGLYGLFLLLSFTNGCWMPAYALVRSTSPGAIAGTALGLLNFAFFLGAAVFQQGTGVLLSLFAPSGSSPGDALPVSAYRALFACFAAALVVAAVSVLLTRESPAVASEPGEHDGRQQR